MKITKAWQNKYHACEDGVEWLKNYKGPKNHKDVINALVLENRFCWAVWVLVRVMPTKEARVRFATYCAERVLPVYEERYPDSSVPRGAIDAAKAWVNEPTRKNRGVAAAAAAAAAAYDYYSAAAAAAADAADAAAAAAAAAYDSYSAAARAADAAYAADRKNMEAKIIRYGLQLIED